MGQHGQVVPVLAFVGLSVLALGIMLFRVGETTVLRAQAQTAADAAALAAADELRGRLEGGILGGGAADPNGVDDRSARAVADRYAERNDGRIVAFSRTGLVVRVEVESLDSLGEDSNPPELRGTRGRAVARAELRMRIVAPRPSRPSGAPLTEEELNRLATLAGTPIPVPAWSSLRRSTDDCRSGVDLVHTRDELKIAILRAETSLNQPLGITAAYQSPACSSDSGAVSEPFVHASGAAIDVVPSVPLAGVAREVGLCQPFPVARPVHFALPQSIECAGGTGTLRPGRAFGGDVGGIARFDTRLVPSS